MEPFVNREPLRFNYLYSKDRKRKLTYSSMHSFFRYNQVSPKPHAKFVQNTNKYFPACVFKFETLEMLDTDNKNAGYLVRIPITILKEKGMYNEFRLWNYIFQIDTSALPVVANSQLAENPPSED